VNARPSRPSRSLLVRIHSKPPDGVAVDGIPGSFRGGISSRSVTAVAAVCRFAENPYVVGDKVIKTSHNDPNTAVVVEGSEERSDDNVTVASLGDFEAEDVSPGELAKHCEENEIKYYTYEHPELDFSTLD